VHHQISRKLTFIAEADFHASIFFDQYAWPSIVDDDTCEAAGHGLNNDPCAEFPNRRKSEDIRLRMNAATSACVRHPAISRFPRDHECEFAPRSLHAPGRRRQ